MEIEERLERIEKLLTINGKEALTAAEVALLLNVTEGRIRCLASKRELPFYKSGGRTYFSRTEIEKWMLKDRIPTKEEIMSQASTRIATKHLKRR